MLKKQLNITRTNIFLPNNIISSDVLKKMIIFSNKKFIIAT